MRRTGYLLAAAYALVAPSVFAHHAFSAYYHEDQSMAIEGSVEEFHYRNPHAILKVRVADPQRAGVDVTYTAEWASAGRLVRLGITAETLKPGDIVQIIGSPGRVAGDYRIHLKRIVRPADGWNWGTYRGRR